MTIQSTDQPNVGFVNGTNLKDYEVRTVANRVAREISTWVTATQGSAQPSIFNRAAYVSPDNPYALMETAKSAVENDDIVGGVADVTEGLMLQGIKWESTDADDADIFNQIARDLNLDEVVRQWHREEFTYSQVVMGIWWAHRTYVVRGKSTGGRKRKKPYSIAAPAALTFLDPSKVVPLPPGPFGQDRLAWHASREEYASAVAAADGLYGDEVMRQFLLRPLRDGELSRSQRQQLTQWGIAPERLILLNPRTVFRACRTKMSYEQFPAVRLKSIFPLLDLKQQLMESDRISLVGAANFIILVKQGSKDEPAMPEEIANLKDNFASVAKLPVIIGDHRLNIEIITPDQEFTLKPEKYDTLDRRILNRAMGSFALSSSSQRTDSSGTVVRGVARQLENRRHMMKRHLEAQIGRAITQHPANVGKFDSDPNLVFSPRNVQLDSDTAMVNAIMSLRTQRELSRESVLDYFGFDQLTEALRREFEESSGLDDIFKTQVPFSAVGGGDEDSGESSQVSGARGGRPVGGGKSRQSVQGQVRDQTDQGNPRTGE